MWHKYRKFKVHVHWPWMFNASIFITENWLLRYYGMHSLWCIKWPLTMLHSITTPLPHLSKNQYTVLSLHLIIWFLLLIYIDSLLVCIIGKEDTNAWNTSSYKWKYPEYKIQETRVSRPTNSFSGIILYKTPEEPTSRVLFLSRLLEWQSLCALCPNQSPCRTGGSQMWSSPPTR